MLFKRSAHSAGPCCGLAVSCSIRVFVELMFATALMCTPMHIHRKRLLKRSLPCPYHDNFDKRQTIPKISNFWLKNAPGGDLGHQKPRQNWGKIGPKPCLGMWRSTISANRSFLPKRAVDLDPILASLWGPKIDLKHALGRKLGHRRTIFNDFSDFPVFLSFPARFCFDF